MFHCGDKVFAKVKGHPFWPARVNKLPPDVKVPKGKYPIFFYGTHEVYFVQAKDVRPYATHKAKLGQPNRKHLFNEGMIEIENNPDILLYGKDPMAEIFLKRFYKFSESEAPLDEISSEEKLYSSEPVPGSLKIRLQLPAVKRKRSESVSSVSSSGKDTSEAEDGPVMKPISEKLPKRRAISRCASSVSTTLPIVLEDKEAPVMNACGRPMRASAKRFSAARLLQGGYDSDLEEKESASSAKLISESIFPQNSSNDEDYQPSFVKNVNSCPNNSGSDHSSAIGSPLPTDAHLPLKKRRLCSISSPEMETPSQQMSCDASQPLLSFKGVLKTESTVSPLSVKDEVDKDLPISPSPKVEVKMKEEPISVSPISKSFAPSTSISTQATTTTTVAPTTPPPPTTTIIRPKLVKSAAPHATATTAATTTVSSSTVSNTNDLAQPLKIEVGLAKSYRKPSEELRPNRRVTFAEPFSNKDVSPKKSPHCIDKPRSPSKDKKLVLKSPREEEILELSSSSSASPDSSVTTPNQQKNQKDKLFDVIKASVENVKPKNVEKIQQNESNNVQSPVEEDDATTEARLLVTIREIKSALIIGQENYPACIAALESIRTKPLRLVVLARVPEVSETIKKCRKYKLSEKVKQAAQEVYNKFLELSSNASPEEMRLAEIETLKRRRLQQQKALAAQQIQEESLSQPSSSGSSQTQATSVGPIATASPRLLPCSVIDLEDRKVIEIATRSPSLVSSPKLVIKIDSSSNTPSKYKIDDCSVVSSTSTSLASSSTTSSFNSDTFIRLLNMLCEGEWVDTSQMNCRVLDRYDRRQHGVHLPRRHLSQDVRSHSPLHVSSHAMLEDSHSSKVSSPYPWSRPTIQQHQQPSLATSDSFSDYQPAENYYSPTVNTPRPTTSLDERISLMIQGKKAPFHSSTEASHVARR